LQCRLNPGGGAEPEWQHQKKGPERDSYGLYIPEAVQKRSDLRAVDHHNRAKQQV